MNSSTESELKRTGEIPVLDAVGWKQCFSAGQCVFSSLSLAPGASLLYWWSDNVLQKSKMKINFSVQSEPSMLCKKLCRPSVTALSYVSCCALEVPSPTQDPCEIFDELLCVSSTWNQCKEHRPRRLQSQFSTIFNLK